MTFPPRMPIWRAGICAALFAATSLSFGHEDMPGKLGKVAFKVECNAAAQQEFNRSIAFLHSFAYEFIAKSLNQVLAADPNCAMAYWIRALAVLDNPFTWPIPHSVANLGEGIKALDAARKAGLKTERERDYVEALAVLFKDHDKLNYRARLKSLEEAFGRLAQKYPDDKEASIFYGLFLSVNFDPADRQFTNQLRATRVLEPIFLQQPEHPGIAHYLIHSYDYPPIALHGLDAAKRYAKIAPDATHAQHMPSHIFTRVGYWRDSIESNAISAKVDGDQTYNSPHAYDYQVYGYLQLGQDDNARKVIAHAFGVAKKTDHFGSAFAYAAMPARFALERGAWQEAAKLTLSGAGSSYPWHKYPQAEAINAFARGVGAARSGDAAAARAEITRLRAFSEALKGMRLGYWVEQVEIQADVIGGLATLAEGKAADGLAMLRKAADREDATTKHAVTPGPLLPAREILGQVLSDRGEHAAALAAFESVLDKEPNRYRAFAGAAQAAERLGDAKKAAYYHARVIEFGNDAVVPRAEVIAARRHFRM